MDDRWDTTKGTDRKSRIKREWKRQEKQQRSLFVCFLFVNGEKSENPTKATAHKKTCVTGVPPPPRLIFSYNFCLWRPFLLLLALLLVCCNGASTAVGASVASLRPAAGDKVVVTDATLGADSFGTMRKISTPNDCAISKQMHRQ